jgi:hypothetical protein
VHGNGDRHELREWSSVIWNGSSRTPTVVGPSQLTVTIAADAANIRSGTVRVVSGATTGTAGRWPPECH